MTNQEAINLIDNLKGMIEDNHNSDYDMAFNMAIKALEQEPKTGHWMIVYRKSIYAHLVCDKCLSNAPYDCRTNYCPNCGARMVEPQESEDK